MEKQNFDDLFSGLHSYGSTTKEAKSKEESSIKTTKPTNQAGSRVVKSSTPTQRVATSSTDNKTTKQTPVNNTNKQSTTNHDTRKQINKSTTKPTTNTTTKVASSQANSVNKYIKHEVDSNPTSQSSSVNKYIKQTNKPTSKPTKPESKGNNSGISGRLGKQKTSTQPAKNGTDNVSTSIEPIDELDVIVTNDGRTLKEMLPNLSSHTVGIVKKIDDLALYNQDDKTDLEDKTTPRMGYQDKMRERMIHQNARRRAQSKFVQRNTKYTEDEKIIMANLGLDKDRLHEITSLPESKLSKHDKLLLLDAGVQGPTRLFKGKRFRSTRGDTDMLEFLAKFKLASPRILSLLRGESQSITGRRLRRLKVNGLVADYDMPGLGTVWTLTTLGMGIAGYDLTTYTQRKPKMSGLPPIIGINYIAACLWHNSFNVLFMEPFPQSNKSMRGANGKTWKSNGEDLISELEIRSSFGKEIMPKNGVKGTITASSQDMVVRDARLQWHNWAKNGRDVDSPETYPGNEYMWILFPEGGLTVSFHVPDLVISRPRASDGSPKSIAIECELTRKSHKNYVDTMRAYMEDKYVYDKVIWVTNNSAIQRRIKEAAEEIGYTNYDIVPFTNESGIYRNRDIWYI